MSRKDSRIAADHPLFVCTISYTATSEIPGLTVAGANPELVKYTPAADAEFLHYGHCRCIPSVPATPDGKPTPAVITRAALSLSSMPFLVVDAGSKVKPNAPHTSFGLDFGKDITKQNALGKGQAEQAFEYGRVYGMQLARACDLLVLGESIPGGTTTALALLNSLGIDARFKVSSSMPENPHDKKNKVLQLASERAGEGSVNAFEAVSIFGDPMIPSVAGMAEGASSQGTQVLLAGGTQMAAVLAFLKASGGSLDKIAVGTTSYVANDRTADLIGLISAVSSEIPVFACDLHLAQSTKAGLRAFSEGFVKEGVGAGGTSIAAIMSRGSLSGTDIMKAAEKEYEEHIEAPLRNQRDGSVR